MISEGMGWRVLTGLSAMLDQWVRGVGLRECYLVGVCEVEVIEAED